MRYEREEPLALDRTVLSVIQNEGEPIDPAKIERIVFPKSLPKEHRSDVLIAIDSLRREFPGNLATVINGPKRDAIYWYKT